MYPNEPRDPAREAVTADKLNAARISGTLFEPGPDRVAPGVGRIVHYTSHGTPPRGDGSQAYESECRAAIVTEVGVTDLAPDVSVGLMVGNPTGLFFNRYVEHDPDRHGGTWHWHWECEN